MVAALCLGCSTRLALHPAALPASPEVEPIARPLLIDFVELKRDGISQAVDESLTNRVAMDFRQDQAFAAVIEPIDAHRAPRDAVRVSVVLDSAEGAHAFVNGVKGLFTVLSLFLLTPVIRFDIDAETRGEAVLRTCDGWTKTLSSRAHGSLRSGLFAPEESSEMALWAGVLERTLGRLVADIGRDSELREHVARIERSDEPLAACGRSAAP